MVKRSLAVVLAVLLVAPVIAQAKINKVTGTVTEVRDDAIVVQRGKQQLEIGRSPGTLLQGDLKKGSRVTVEYRMNATSIEVKAAKADRKK